MSDPRHLTFIVSDLFDAVMPLNHNGPTATTVDHVGGYTVTITAEPPDETSGAWSIVIQGDTT